MKDKTLIIINNGKSTYMIYGGKMYGKDIKEIIFHHKAHEDAELELNVKGIDFENLSEPISPLVKEIINNVMEEKID